MKVQIANGTPVECGSVEIDGPVLKAYGSPEGKGRIKMQGPLILAYHLHPGETLRADFSGAEVIYAITQ